MKPAIFSSLLPVLVLALCAPASAADTANGVLNANTATAEQLGNLPHLDEVMVKVVIDNRPFVSIGEMHEILLSDLDEEQLAELYVQLFVPLNLNIASRDDILLIPGLGSKMAHEFEEYRPYSDMEQFRREMGKYVDAAEVARLEQYVTLD
jgi:DNA uptake protein ComE-like DNA-binding protein